ncbi:MAG: winged helix-turn-helix domain-containing protein [Candidatus Nitrosopolaris sp.]
MKQEKRHKLQLFYEILCAIDDVAKPTHIQHSSRLSYDKLMNHINQLEQKGMIYRHKQDNGAITITKKGNMFVTQYKELMNLIESAVPHPILIPTGPLSQINNEGFSLRSHTIFLLS